MGEIAEAERGATEVLESAVDRFGGAVAGAGVVEVGQHVQGPSFQGSTEGDQLGELRGQGLLKVWLTPGFMPPGRRPCGEQARIQPGSVYQGTDAKKGDSVSVMLREQLAL